MNEQNIIELMYCAYHQGYNSIWNQVFNKRFFSLRTYIKLKEIAQTY